MDFLKDPLSPIPPQADFSALLYPPELLHICPWEKWGGGSSSLVLERTYSLLFHLLLHILVTFGQLLNLAITL